MKYLLFGAMSSAVMLYGLGGLSLVLGLFPHLLFTKMENTLTHWVAWIVK